MAATTKNEAIRAQILDIAREGKTHVGELQTLLLQSDTEQVDGLVLTRITSKTLNIERPT